MTAKEIKRTLQSEFVRTLRKPFVDAVKAYGLVKPSDKVAVCISGGKDSMLLALLLQDLQHTVDFDLMFLAMDPGYAPEGRKHLEENAKRLDIPLEIFDTDVLRVAGVHSAELRASCAQRCAAAICTPKHASAAAIKSRSVITMMMPSAPC